MAKKTEKKISINTIEKMIKANPIKPILHTVEVDGEKVDIIVTPYIDAKTYAQLIQDIVDGCFIEDQYYPALKDFTIILNLFDKFTNIKTDNIAVIYDFIKCNPQLSMVVCKDITDVYDSIYVDVKEAISWRKEQILHKSDLSKIADKVVEILDNLEDKFSNLSEDDFAKMFNIASNLSSKNEKEIVKAVLDYQTANKVQSDKG